MPWFDVKLVSNAEPNAEGDWAYHYYAETLEFAETPLAPGKHIVAVRLADRQSAPPGQPFYMHSVLRGDGHV